MNQNPPKCPDCGAVLSGYSLGGLCPRCLLAGFISGEQGTGRDADLVGTRIDRYTIIERIGQGGMGTVWRAKQEEPVEREVAIKLVKLGMDTRAVVARFEAECQVLAKLDHPNIATLFDAGTTATGRPYYVMELVEGLPVTDYCERNQLAIHDRLALFSRICGAVQHAHTRGIIHRDLKPTNVLVADHQEGRLKVIDFGVAKVVGKTFAEETLFTGEGQMLGTPGYMSPEQAEGDPAIDGRADVYSLGALLYEMLSGTPPFTREGLRNAGLLEILRIIREVEPPKPSTRLNATGAPRTRVVMKIANDLDWIALKALAKDPARRYATPAELAEDVARHLRRETTSARAPGPVIRLARFLRRHRTVAAALATAALGIAVTLLIVAPDGNHKRPEMPPPATVNPDATGPRTGPKVPFNFATAGKDVLTVTTATDENDGIASGKISLREAIVHTVPGKAEVIRFDPAVFTGGKANIIRLAFGQLVIRRNLIIDASGLNEGITIDAGGNSRVFLIDEGSAVLLDSLQVMNGYQNEGERGGGIHIFPSDPRPVVTMRNCTFRHNSSVEGGGIYSWGRPLILENCTFHENSGQHGGAIQSREVTRASHCTFAGNRGGTPEGTGGGGIWVHTGSAAIANCIFTDNTGNYGPDLITMSGAKLFLAGANLVHGGLEGPNHSGPAPLGADPRLSPLGNHGGPVPTMPPLSGSPAIDAALPESTGALRSRAIDGDGDGVARPDIGAAEFDPAADQ